MEQRNSGTVEQWNSGTVKQWQTGGGGDSGTTTQSTRKGYRLLLELVIEDGHFIVILCYALLKIPHFVAIQYSIFRQIQAVHRCETVIQIADRTGRPLQT